MNAQKTRPGVVGLLAIAICVVMGAALIAPPLFWLGQALVAKNILPALKPFGLPVYFRRVILVTTLALLAGFWARSKRYRSLGRPLGPRPGRDFAMGLSTGLIILIPAMFYLTAVGALDWPRLIHHHSTVENFQLVLIATMTALCVGFLEEVIFRGMLLTFLKKNLRSPTMAVVVSAALFALLHFIAQPRYGSSEEDVRWYAGLVLLSDIAEPFFHLRATMLPMTTLVLLGVTLAWTTLVTQGLAYAMGLHAAVVFVARMATLGATIKPGWQSLLTNDMRGGKLPPMAMALMFSLAIVLTRDRLHRPARPPAP